MGAPIVDRPPPGRRRGMAVPGVSGLLLLLFLLCSGCLYSQYGYNHVIKYAARTDEARAELIRVMEEGNALRDVVGVNYHRRGDDVYIRVACTTKGMTGPEVRELRQKVEATLGPDLVKRLHVSTDWWPIP